ICFNFRRYEHSSFFRGAADLRAHNHAMENRWLARRRNFRNPISYPVDRVRTREEKCHSVRLLGMQRTRIVPVARLFRHLPTRFGGRVAKYSAPADLSAEFVFSLHPSSRETSRGRAAPGRMI